MASETTTSPPRSMARISKIAGRYLIFDQEDAAFLRRQENINGVLVGTLPQQPTQNIFLGLPIELRPEEAEALVHKNVARVVDDVAAHQAALRNPDRTAYIQSLRRDKQIAHKILIDRTAQKVTDYAAKSGRAKKNKPAAPAADAAATTTTATNNSVAPDEEESLFGSAPTTAEPSSRPTADVSVNYFGVTQTSSRELLCPSVSDSDFVVPETSKVPLVRFLQAGGYHMTPGLRFGAKYSVYPGDPLRFHAHYMANQYDWDEEFSVLDIVEGGRLATAVKKAFVIGGEEPNKDPSAPDSVRTYSIEWASM